MHDDVDELAPGGWRRAVIGVLLGLGLGAALRVLVGDGREGRR